MKVAFVSGNREKLPDAVIPLGLPYVMASTPGCHEKALLDLCFEEDPEDALLGHPPEVGLAVRLRELVWAAPGVVYLLARRWVAPAGDSLQAASEPSPGRAAG